MKLNGCEFSAINDKIIIGCPPDFVLLFPVVLTLVFIYLHCCCSSNSYDNLSLQEGNAFRQEELSSSCANDLETKCFRRMSDEGHATIVYSNQNVV